MFHLIWILETVLKLKELDLCDVILSSPVMVTIVDS